MAKKVVSSVPLHKKKPMKRDTKKKLLFKKVLQYLKFDPYMFAPLLYSHRSHSLPTETGSAISTGVEKNEPTEKVNKKLHRKVGDYLKSDCYMYAPLVTPQPWLYASICAVNDPRTGFRQQDADTGRQSESMKKVSEDRNEQGGKSTTIIREDQQLKGYPRAGSSVVRHSILQRETVKHIVHSKCRSPSVPGKGSVESEARKVVAK